jgi:hypothetical protein
MVKVSSLITFTSFLFINHINQLLSGLNQKASDMIEGF